MKKLSPILSVIAIAISIAAICFVLCRIEPITIDWMGMLVGILSMLVVILIGWNIATLVDARGIYKEFESLKNNYEKKFIDLKNEADKNSYSMLYGALSAQIGSLLNIYNDNNRMFAAFLWAITVTHPLSYELRKDKLKPITINMNLIFIDDSVILDIIKLGDSILEVTINALKFLAPLSDEAALLLAKFIQLTGSKNK